MEKFDITKAAFISTSRENWMMLKKVNEKDTYKIVQALADYILEGKEPDCTGGDLVSIVTEQFKSVIDRKGQKARNSVANFRKSSEKQSNPVVVSTEDKEPTIKVTNEDYTKKAEEDDNVKEWYVQVKCNDSERFFNSTYSQYFHTIDDAKEAVLNYYNKLYKPSWLL